MLQNILESHGFALKHKSGEEYSCPCPFCGGQDRFCVWIEKNNYWCRQCNEKGDEIDLLRHLEGLSFQEAAEKTGKPLLTKRDERAVSHSKILETYDYVDQSGTLLFQVCRHENKEFKQRRPHKTQKDRWIENMADTPRVLYCLLEVIPSAYVLFVEGEKDVNNLKRLGFIATTNPGGAEKLPNLQDKWQILDPLEGKKVYILPDNDGPGRTHAKQCASLLSDKAKEIKIVNLPDLPKKGDVSDFIEKHGQEAKSKLIEIITSTPLWAAPKRFYTIADLLAIPSDNHRPIISNGIMPHGSHIIIAGESGVGKSLLRLELAIHMAMGWSWLGFEIPSAKRVGILQWENTEIMERNRSRTMLEGLAILPEALGDRLKWSSRLYRPDLTLKGDREKLALEVQKLGCEVVVYDCLSNLHTSNENDNIKMRNVLDILTDINIELGISSIVIHHFGKPVEGATSSAYRTRGASSIIDWAVTAIGYIAKSHENRVLRELQFFKVRDGPIPKPLLLERDEHLLLSIADEGTLCSPIKVREILQELGGEVERQSWLIDEIVKQVGCSRRSANSYVKRAVEMREIKEIVKGNGKSKSYHVV